MFNPSDASGRSRCVVDIGGRPVAGGGHLRRGLLYRFSGDLIRAEELDDLVEVGLRLIVDLRSEAEDRTHLSAAAHERGLEYLQVPVPLGAPAELVAATRAGSSAETAAALVRSVYRSVIDQHGDALVHAITNIADRLPAAFGCDAGKDRTGVLAAVLQSLAGVATADIAFDYVALAPDPSRIRACLRTRGWSESQLAEPGIQTLLGAVEETILETLQYLDEHWGGIDHYLNAHGLGAATLDRLRDQLVEPPARA
jgi:protein-tyrosine phosphatase